MNTLREKIEDILIKEKYTFSQLADYLNLSEEQLENGLANKTLELRHLEDISKNLKVPLYSFFRDHNVKINYSEKPYFTNKLWNEDEESVIIKAISTSANPVSSCSTLIISNGNPKIITAIMVFL